MPLLLKDKTFQGYGIELRPVTPYDLPSLRRWRNSTRISSNMLDNSYITPHRQRLWYEQIRDRDDQAHWVVWCKGVRTGYVNIKGEGPLESQAQVEGGAYIGDSKVNNGLLGYSMSMMQLGIAFEYLSISEFRSVVREKSHRVRQFNQQMGFREEGEDNGFIRIAMDPSDYKTAKTRFARYFDDDRLQQVG